jgi:AcrR family transcriptional regulator
VSIHSDNKNFFEEHRQKILDAALKVFSQNGYNASTIKQIAKKAKVAEGTIYLYFKNKKELLLNLVEHPFISSFKELMENLTLEDDYKNLKIILNDRLKFASEHIQLMQLLLYESQFHKDLKKIFIEKVLIQAISPFEKYLKKRIKEGKFRKFDPAFLAQLFFGMFLSMLYTQKVLKDKNLDASSLKQLVDLFLNGVKK